MQKKLLVSIDNYGVLDLAEHFNGEKIYAALKAFDVILDRDERDRKRARYRKNSRGETVVYGPLERSLEELEDSAPFRSADDVETEIEERDLKKRLRQAISLLSENDRELLSARYFSDGAPSSMRELAKKLGVNASTVMRREEKIIAKLRELMKV